MKTSRVAGRIFGIAVTACALAAWTVSMSGQVPTSAFSLTGYIEHFELCRPANDPGCQLNDPLSMARMRVNGVEVVLPRNLIITMPGSYLTAHDLFRGPNGTPASPVLAKSGLAIDDPLPPGMTPHVAEIVGNIVNGTYVAGIVRVSHEPLQVSSGYITSIDVNTGELRVGPKDATTGGVRVRLNDPEGRFGRAQSPDRRFKVDDENPTVHAASGYPVCIPRSLADPLCPAANRPTDNGQPSTRFTMGAVRAVVDAPPCATGCNPNLMAPLRVGDYVTFAGIPASDGGVAYTSAYMLEADLGIFTSPGANPVYVSQEVTLIGTGGIPFPGLDQETGPGKVIPGQASVTRFRIVGFTTDPSRNVDVFAVDVSPTANTEWERPIVQIRPESVAPMSRFRVTVDQAVFLPPPAEIRVRVQGASGQPATPNGLEWGQYSAPVSEYIFPEGRIYGRAVVPANFESLCFLSKGSGPLKTMGRNAGPVAGRLSPFPDSGHPVEEVACRTQ